MTWTPERIEELTQLWEAGLSASEIGKRLNVSKNAVVGKAHRLKLSARPSPIRRDGSTSSKPRRRTMTVGIPATAARPNSQPQVFRGTAQGQKSVEPASGATPQERRSDPPRATEARLPFAPQPRKSAPRGHKCQWPIGDPTDHDFHFCGAPAAVGKPYCEHHCAMAYVSKTRDREKETAAA